jgi:hypothetical protein
VTGLYRRDLGAPPPDRIRRPLDRPRPAADAPLIRLEAYTLGGEIGDPCWEALALRGLALIAQRERRAGQARNLLTEAVACCRRLFDVYRWAEVVVLTDLLELDPAPDEAETARALRLATAGPMPDLFELRNRSKLETPTQRAAGRPRPGAGTTGRDEEEAAQGAGLLPARHLRPPGRRQGPL